MEMRKFNLPQKAWFGDEDLQISLPGNWDISVADIPADYRGGLTAGEIEEKLLNPVGCLPLPELARGTRKAVIIFDDLTRPTKVADIVPHVVAQLLDTGIKESNISFVCSLGAHGAHTRLDFEKKLGADIVNRFAVYNHNPYENCEYVGKTQLGTPLYINKEVVDADLKIGIGCLLPHPFNGFGGGGKIILPGVCSMETIYENHKLVIKDFQERNVGFVGNMGIVEDSKMRADVEDAARMLPLHFKIDVLPNSKREAVEISAGDPLKAYKNGIETAQKLYAAHYYKGADVVIANANAKGSEALIAMLVGAHSLKPEGGNLVTVVDSPLGQVVHYLFNQFGESCGGRLWSGGSSAPSTAKKNILYSSYPGQRFGLCRDMVECHKWEEVLEMLRENTPDDAKAVIYKDATMQYVKE